MDLTSKVRLSEKIVNDVKALILVFDKDNNLLFQNADLKSCDLISCDDPPKIGGQEIDKIADGEEFVTETLMEGSTQWMKWNTSGTENGLKIFIGQDISELKKQEIALLEISDRSRKYARRIEALHKLDSDIISSPTFEDSVEKALTFINDTVPGSCRVSLMTFSRTGAVVNAILKSGKQIDFVNRHLPLDHLPGIKSISKGYLYVPELRESANLSLIEEELRNDGIISFVAFPIWTETQVTATIDVGFKDLETFSTKRLIELRDIVQELGFFIRQIQLRKLVQQKNDSLIHKNRQLQKANDELRHFAYVTSHDLKAPLRAVSSLARFLYEDHIDVLGDEGKNQLTLLRQRVGRMDTMINGILEYSRIGRITEEHREIDIRKLIHSIYESLSPPDHIAIKFGQLPILQCEPTRMEQVFQNLISNAVKFNDKDQGIVRIACQQNDNNLLFSVEDNGIGIDPKSFDRIFSLFQSAITKKSDDNTGIGLTITKKCIETMGGKIWVESEPEKGSTFYFTLPSSCCIKFEHDEVYT